MAEGNKGVFGCDSRVKPPFVPNILFCGLCYVVNHALVDGWTSIDFGIVSCWFVIVFGGVLGTAFISPIVYVCMVAMLWFLWNPPALAPNYPDNIICGKPVGATAGETQPIAAAGP